MPRTKAVYLPAYALCQCTECRLEQKDLTKRGRLIITDQPKPTRQQIEEIVNDLYGKD